MEENCSLPIILTGGDISITLTVSDEVKKSFDFDVMAEALSVIRSYIEGEKRQ